MGARLLSAMAPVSGEVTASSEAARGGLRSLALQAWEKAITRDFPVLLTEWAADAIGRPSCSTLDASAAWSGLYLAAKLLDDLQDGDVGLLGPDVPVPSVLNLSTALVFASQVCLADGSDDDAPMRARLAREFARYSLEVAEGQELGMGTAPSGEAVLSWAWEVLRKKGALPFALACRAGAISGGGSSAAVDLMTGLGACLGEAVQLMDDALGLQGRDTADIRSLSIPLAYALSVADEEDGRALECLKTAALRGDGDAAEALCSLLERMGAMQYLSISAAAAVERARALLASPHVRRTADGAQALVGVVDWLDPSAPSPPGS